MMRIVKTIRSLRQSVLQARSEGKKIGFVPTMGFLHEGHASLLSACKKEHDVSVLSIFVNPMQFGPHEDLKDYPRDIKKDEKLAKRENVDIIFYPSVDEIYPMGFRTTVEVADLSDRLCGSSRPGHFKGVTTVVLKLLNVVAPDAMYLGQKDAQQAFIIRKMVDDLNVPVRIKVLETVREKDGLAMSSRNSYLTSHERKEAPVLYQALSKARESIKAGERRSFRVTQMMRMMIERQTNAKVDYIQCVDTNNLQPVSKIAGEVLIALAVKFGRARLIDNVIVHAHD